MNNPEVTGQALSILRSGENFHWSFITLFVLVVYVYYNEIEKKNWNVIAAGLTLYMIHWFVEIVNALIQYFSGHALWTAPTGTSFLILVGLSIEINMMFAIAALTFAKILPKDPRMKILGINNRLLIGIGCAAFASFLEIFFVKTPAFAWVYPWWGSIPVFITVYIPFFVVAFYVHDWTRRNQKIFIGSSFVLNAFMMVLFAGILKWI
ncbi:MAG: hypothetical protein R6X10_18760 [Desulfobacterales bacterium]